MCWPSFEPSTSRIKFESVTTSVDLNRVRNTQLKGHYVNQAKCDTTRKHEFFFHNFSQVTVGYDTYSPPKRQCMRL